MKYVGRRGLCAQTTAFQLTEYVLVCTISVHYTYSDLCSVRTKYKIIRYL